MVVARAVAEGRHIAGGVVRKREGGRGEGQYKRLVSVWSHILGVALESQLKKACIN